MCVYMCVHLYVYMCVCVYVCIYMYMHTRVGVHMHSCRRILLICTVQSQYYMRVYHRCFSTPACVCSGCLEVGFFSSLFMVIVENKILHLESSKLNYYIISLRALIKINLHFTATGTNPVTYQRLSTWPKAVSYGWRPKHMTM